MSTINYNVTAVSVDRFADIYSKLVIRAVKNGFPVSSLHAVFLWGAPGVGKSQGISELAKLIQEGTGKRVDVTDVRLLLFNPVDLRGIPTSNSEKTAAIWLKPQIFDMDSSDEVINILFLDELSAAPPAVQAAAYQLVLDKKVGEHSLPANTIVIGAGNRVGDNSVSYNMPKALANRFSHFEIICDANQWIEWALKHGINTLVTGYIAYDTTKLIAECDSDDIAYPTPRTWEFVSDLLNMRDQNEELSELFPFISSYIGKSVAEEFITWAKNYAQLPSVINICEGMEENYPSTPDQKYILCNSLATYITGKFRVSISDEELTNAVIYINKLSKDYIVNLYKKLFSVNGLGERLENISEFCEWADKNKRSFEMIKSRNI